MARCLFGMETEYALVAGSSEHPRLDAAESLMSLARRRLPHLRGAYSSGLFLQNGGRLYVDAGSHPEFATAEVDAPEDLVRYLAAGDAELAELVGELRAANRHQEGPILLKSNICYANPGVTWASHESYLHSAPSAVMPKHLIPFLVSRVLFGSGGLNPLCPGILFSMSPRAHLFTRTIGDSTTSERPIFNCRTESLTAGRTSRLHVIVGDSSHSQLSQYIKIGSTALAVLLAELGVDLGGTMELACPLIALHSFATNLGASADRTKGPPLSAIDIQRHYLRKVEEYLDHKEMPPWAIEVCGRWRAALNLAANGPSAAVGVFDWAVKKAMFDQHIIRRAIKSETLGVWNQALTCVRDAHRRTANTWRFDQSILFSDHPAVVTERQNQATFLKSHGLCWDEAPAILDLRAELCEIDVRCAQIMPAGLFSEITAHLPHTLIEPERIQQSRREPPQRTRARIRGEQIRLLAGRRGCAAEWQSVHNDEGMFLDLGDPFDNAPVWKPVPADPIRPPPLQPVRQCAILYDHGDYAAAYTKASQILMVTNGGNRLCDDDRRKLLRIIAWTRARRGELDAAMAVLETLAAETTSPGMPIWLIIDHIGVIRKSTLEPSGERFWELIREGERILEQVARIREPSDAHLTRPLLLAHKGYALARNGRALEAVEPLRRACAGSGAVSERIRARTLADIADALRMLGDTENAARVLADAEQLQVQHHFLIDHADHSLTVRAKLTQDRREGYRLLRGAERTLARGGARVALARTLLLQARLCPRACRCALLHRQLTALLDTAPSLRRCPAVTRILSHWDEWIHGGADPVVTEGKSDPFWCL